MRTIDADALLKNVVDEENAAAEWRVYKGKPDEYEIGVHNGLTLAHAMILKAPTIDAVEVVRCKDCDNWCEEMKVGYPEFNNVTAPCSVWSDQENGMARYTHENGFCSEGIRKETYNG